MSLDLEASLPFDFDAPIEFYAGEFPPEVLSRAADLQQAEQCLNQKDAICLAMKQIIGGVATSDTQPQRIVA